MSALRLVCLVAFALVAVDAATAQSRNSPPANSYPEKSIRLLVGVPPGGSTDIVARILGARLAEALGQQILIDNRSGAGGIIAADTVARSSPDGYTLLFAYASHTSTPFLYRNLPYDPLRSFTPITEVATQPLLLIANSSLQANTVAELVAYAKANPGRLSIGISSAGSSGHIASEHFKQLTKTDITSIIYKGAGPNLVALMSGEVQLSFSSTSGAMSFIQQGKMKALTTTSKRRLPYLPQVPTIDEAGLTGLEGAAWQGILGPRGMPRAIVDRVYAETAKLLRLPEMIERLAATGSDPLGSTPEEFATEIKRQLVQLGKVIKAAGIKSE